RVVSMMRAHGQPDVRPRIVSASSRGPRDDDAIRARLESSRRPGTRCGVALVRPEPASGKEGSELFVAVAVDALADLDALPTRARTGEWLTFSSLLHVPATSAKLVVLGPRGLPRTVPTSIERTSTGPMRVRARFALDRPGAFTVQLIADLENGPLPLLEAHVFADIEPPPDDETGRAPVPGEDLAGGDDGAAALARMTAALRASESLAPLRRDDRLDAIAHAHAEQMKTARTIAHDLGDGDLALRFESAGLAAKVVGENVARARSVALAHRAPPRRLHPRGLRRRHRRVRRRLRLRGVRERAALSDAFARERTRAGCTKDESERPARRLSLSSSRRSAQFFWILFVSSCSRILNSTRRFFARPASVSFSSIGLSMP
ncbi:MAG: hypothetical protein J0I07_04815, partial [Myxococcales bacterium]|nr:hypothetical protein [Myxococcales bacterium]